MHNELEGGSRQRTTREERNWNEAQTNEQNLCSLHRDATLQKKSREEQDIWIEDAEWTDVGSMTDADEDEYAII